MPECGNATPFIYKIPKGDNSDNNKVSDKEKEIVINPTSRRDIFDLVRVINDPEHPLTLEELNVIQEDLISFDGENKEIKVLFTPTIPHCSMAALIGLSIRVKLLRCLSPKFKVTVEITPGTHSSEFAVNKQLADKERVAAALENNHLIEVINECIGVDSD